MHLLRKFWTQIAMINMVTFNSISLLCSYTKGKKKKISFQTISMWNQFCGIRIFHVNCFICCVCGVHGDNLVSFGYNISHQSQMYFIDEWFPYVGEPCHLFRNGAELSKCEYNSNQLIEMSKVATEWNELCSHQTFRIGHRRVVFIITYLLPSYRQDVLQVHFTTSFLFHFIKELYLQSTNISLSEKLVLLIFIQCILWVA